MFDVDACEFAFAFSFSWPAACAFTCSFAFWFPFEFAFEFAFAYAFRSKTHRKWSQTVAKMIQIGSNRLGSGRFGPKRGIFASDVAPKRVHKQQTHIFAKDFHFQTILDPAELIATHRNPPPRNSKRYQFANPFD